MSQVDVIVPCYQYGHFLRECVNSVLAQEAVELRVLVLDDASPDDTAAIGAELVAGDPRVEFRRHAVNQGHIATYNEGLDWASGEYTLLLDADDLLTPGALARAARLMDARPEVALTYGRAIVTRDPRAQPCRPPADYSWEIVDSAAWIEACCRIGGNRVPTPTAVCRTRVLNRLGGYRADLPHAADMELWLRLAAAGPIGVLDCDQAYYRRHGANMSLRYAGLGDLRERKAVFEIFFAAEGQRLAECQRLRDLALRRLAQDACRQATAAFLRPNARLCRELLAFASEVQPPCFEPAWRGWQWLRLVDPLGRCLLRWLKACAKSGCG